MAKINKHVGEFKADAYDVNGTFLGTIETFCELLDFKVQIKNEHRWGYYLILNKKDGTKIAIKIDVNGNIDYNGDEFDFVSECLMQLV